MRVAPLALTCALAACMRPPRPFEGRVTQTIDREHVRIRIGPVNLRVMDRVTIYRRHCARPPRPRLCRDAPVVDGTVVRALDDWTFVVRLHERLVIPARYVVKRSAPSR